MPFGDDQGCLDAQVYAAARPPRVLVLGCPTGSDFMPVDPTVRRRAVGVDVNGEYLTAARLKITSHSDLVKFVQVTKCLAVSTFRKALSAETRK
ncbi:MAG: hypothetical protein ABIS92_18765 [Polyangia bacterium]